jgi:hypothetical protein
MGQQMKLTLNELHVERGKNVQNERGAAGKERAGEEREGVIAALKKDIEALEEEKKDLMAKLERANDRVERLQRRESEREAKKDVPVSVKEKGLWGGCQFLLLF